MLFSRSLVRNASCHWAMVMIRMWISITLASANGKLSFIPGLELMLLLRLVSFGVSIGPSVCYIMMGSVSVDDFLLYVFFSIKPWHSVPRYSGELRAFAFQRVFL